ALGGVSLGLDGPSLVSGMLSPPLSSSPSGGPWGPSGASWSPSCCGGGAGTKVSVSCGTVVVGGAVDVSGVDFVVLDVVLLLVLAGTGGWSASPSSDGGLNNQIASAISPANVTAPMIAGTFQFPGRSSSSSPSSSASRGVSGGMSAASPSCGTCARLS